MRVVAWVMEETWEGCIDGVAGLLAADADVTLVHVVASEAADVAEGAFAGLLGRGGRRRHPGAALEALSERAAAELLEAAAQRLGRPARRVLLRGRPEEQVIAAAGEADVLVAARDGDRRRRGPRSLGPALRFVVDHAPCPVLLVWPGGAPSGGPPPPEPHGPPPPPR